MRNGGLFPLARFRISDSGDGMCASLLAMLDGLFSAFRSFSNARNSHKSSSMEPLLDEENSAIGSQYAVSKKSHLG